MAVHAEKRPAPVAKRAAPARTGASRRSAPIQLRGAGAVLDRAERSLSDRSSTSKPRGRSGLPERLRASVEAQSGLAMDDVRVHRNSDQPARLGALAYTQGSDIHLGPGQERHLPHEAWHVVQQKQGRVKATRQMKGGTAVNDDRTLEREADEMAARTLSSTVRPPAPAAAPSPAPTVVQRMTVGGVAKTATVSGETRKKHVVATADQAAAAQANYGSSTFVTSEKTLTDAVDADAHDFAADPGVRSATHNMYASVVIDLYDKTEAAPAGLAKNKPVQQTIANTATNCEIGVVRTGPGGISIVHFKKA